MLAVLKLFGLGPRRPGRAGTPDRPAEPRRRVWRITDSQPGGAWVDPDTAPTGPADDRSTLPMDSWTTSSMDLLDGVQVVELDDPPPRDPKPH